MEQLFRNYRLLVQKVDQFCRQAVKNHGERIVCRPGCDSCCRHLSLFPIEAFALASAFRHATPHLAASLRRQISEASPEGRCPLLLEGLCALYDARPLICRTHGLPVMMSTQGERRVDCCPHNFTGMETLPGDSVLDLDRLNEMLVAINAVFEEENDTSSGLTERITMAEALLLLDRT